ncbi:hypothetical protein F5Y11DRAFT_341203 [Daldinia sp. FL1419]|nr:hypothetical protein F5Y11DRAFT_341203 [Daldinia sp. FL1419]
MRRPNQYTGSRTGAPYTLTHIDNAKSLSSVMARSTESPRMVAGPSCRLPLTEDREPLLRQPDELNSRYLDINPAAEPFPKRACIIGLPVISFCRVFNTVFALLTIDKVNSRIGNGGNVMVYRHLFDFCWIILIWNIFTFAVSTISSLFFSAYDSKDEKPARSSFRDTLRIHFALNDVGLGLVTLILLVISCNTGGQFVRFSGPAVIMVSSLVALEFLIAMVQPFKFSERIMFGFKCRSRRS